MVERVTVNNNFFSLLAELDTLAASGKLKVDDDLWAEYENIQDKLRHYQNYIPKTRDRH